MADVVAAAGRRRDAAPPSRHDHERHVEHREAGEHDRRQKVDPLHDVLAPRRHRQGSDEEPQEHAAAVAEKDARRAREVVVEEADAGAADRHGQRGKCFGSLGDG
jgi:hypothetical protein